MVTQVQVVLALVGLLVGGVATSPEGSLMAGDAVDNLAGRALIDLCHFTGDSTDTSPQPDMFVQIKVSEQGLRLHLQQHEMDNDGICRSL